MKPHDIRRAASLIRGLGTHDARKLASTIKELRGMDLSAVADQLDNPKERQAMLESWVARRAEQDAITNRKIAEASPPEPPKPRPVNMRAGAMGGGFRRAAYEAKIPTLKCAHCKRLFIAKRADANTCSPSCRTMLSRKRRRTKPKA